MNPERRKHVSLEAVLVAIAALLVTAVIVLSCPPYISIWPLLASTGFSTYLTLWELSVASTPARQELHDDNWVTHDGQGALDGDNPHPML